MKHIFYFIIILLFSINNLFAKINFDSIKTVFPNKEAVILNKTVKVNYELDFSGNLIATITTTEQILLLDDNITKYSNLTLDYSTFEQVEFLSGKIFEITNVGDKKFVENLKFKNAIVKDYFINNIFYNDLKVKILYPTTPLKKRFLYEYSYKKTINDTKFLNRVNIIEDTPILSYSLTLTKPKFVDAYLKEFNLPENTLIDNKIEGENSITTYLINNVKNIITTSNSAPYLYYTPHFVVVTQKYTNNGVTTNVLQNSDDLFNWYNSLIKELKPDLASLKKLSDNIVGDAKTNEQKITKIFDWVKNTITYLAYEDGLAGFKPDEANMVASKCYGDCKGMANLLYELLKAQNLDAHHAWVGTNDIPYNYKLPSLVVDNHMICALDLNGKTYFLDATGKDNDWNIPPYYLEGKETMVRYNDSYKIILIPTSKILDNYITHNYTIDIDNTTKAFNINGAVSLKGNFFYIFKNILNSTSIENLDKFGNFAISYLFDNSILPTNTEYDLKENELILTYKGISNTLLIKNANMLQIIKPRLFNLYYENTSKENAPKIIDFPFTYKSKCTVKGTIKFDKNLNYTYNNDIFSVKQNCIKTSTGLSEDYELSINNTFVDNSKVISWNTMIEQFNTLFGIINITF
jgi:transglutaminase-like putative cysteine protease